MKLITKKVLKACYLPTKMYHDFLSLQELFYKYIFLILCHLILVFMMILI